MRLSLILSAALLSSPISVLALGGNKKPSNAILLSKVRALTLRAGHETTHRRVSALPQLKCIGGNAQGLYDVDVMRCKNSGSEYDAEDISWTCQASLPPEFKLGSTDVVCEGYDSPDDPYVLKGSCAVEYRLVLTPMGEEKYKSRMQSTWRKATKGSQESEGGLSDSVAGYLFWLIFAGIACVIIYSVCFPNAARGRGGGFGNRNNFGGWGGGGGGGPDDGSDDPPPPYTPRGTKPKSTRSSTRNPSSSSASSGPGFWTGAATGAAAGYGAAAWNASRQNRAAAAAQQQRAGPSSWFGGGGNRGQDYGGMAGPSNYASAPAPSSSRHESTGFGGTTRR